MALPVASGEKKFARSFAGATLRTRCAAPPRAFAMGPARLQLLSGGLVFALDGRLELGLVLPFEGPDTGSNRNVFRGQTSDVF